MPCCYSVCRAQQIRPHAQDRSHITGTYDLITKTPSENGDVQVEKISPDSIKFYLSVVRYGDIAETNGSFKVEHGCGIFQNTKAGAKNCPITFTFNEDTLYLKQGGDNGSCGFGLNASVTGYYKRINSQKPSFSVLKREKYNQEHPEAHKKRMQWIAKEEASFKGNLNEHPVKIDSFPSNMDYLTKDSLNKLKDHYNNFLQRIFRNVRYIQGASDIAFKKYAKLYLHENQKTFFSKPRNENFPKHWVGIVKTSKGYGIPAYGKNPVSMEVFGNVVIYNLFGCIGTDWTKDFVQTEPNIYRIHPTFESNKDSLDIFTIKIIDRDHYIATLSTKFMDCDFVAKNYKLLMIPVDSIVNYPILHYPPEISGNGDSRSALPNQAKDPTASRDKIIKLVMYKSKLEQSFHDSSRQKEDKSQLSTEALFLTTRQVPYTLGMLKSNNDFQSFYKEWICVHKKDSGYVLYWNKFNPNIRITDNQIIIDTPEKTYAHFIKSFYKTTLGDYKLITFFPSKDSLDTFTFKTLDPETGMIEANFNLPSTKGIKSYSWKMVPIKNVLKFPFSD